MIEFVENARHWRRKWSTWLAALNAGGWVMALLPFVTFLPWEAQVPVAIVIFLVGWAVPVLAVHIKQKGLRCDDASKG